MAFPWSPWNFPLEPLGSLASPSAPSPPPLAELLPSLPHEQNRGFATRRITIHGLLHEQTCYLATRNRTALPSLPHEQNYFSFKPLERHPHEHNCTLHSLFLLDMVW